MDRPIFLLENYYLMGSFGPNTGFLSLTIAEYNKYEVSPGADSLYKMLIDKDPFVYFYERKNDVGFKDENGPYGIDTGRINDLIRQDELDKYFERMK